MSATNRRGGGLRVAQAKDAARLAEIYAEAVARGGATLDTQPLPPARFAAACEDPRLRLIVALADAPRAPASGESGESGESGALEESRVVGWGRLQPWSHKRGYAQAAEVSIFVAEARWREGHGRRLLARLLELAADMRVHHLAARIFATNLASLVLFERAGFERVGVQRQIGRQRGEWVDVVILQAVYGEGKQVSLPPASGAPQPFCLRGHVGSGGAGRDVTTESE